MTDYQRRYRHRTFYNVSLERAIQEADTHGFEICAMAFVSGQWVVTAKREVTIHNINSTDWE